MALQSYSAATWAGRVRSAANIQTLDNQVSKNARLAGTPAQSRGLILRTHPNADEEADKITLNADAISMDDGETVETWSGIEVDRTASGAGGVDSGSIAASKWYDILAIRKTSDGTKNGMLSLSRYLTEEDFYWENDLSAADGDIGDAAARTKVAQSFTASGSYMASHLDLCMYYVGSPTDSVQFEIQGDASGEPDGTAIATGVLVPCAICYSGFSSATAPWPFRVALQTPVDLTSGTDYWIVASRTGSVDPANYCGWYNSNNGGYVGSAIKYDGSTWSAIAPTVNFQFKVLSLTEESVTYPTGYDQMALVGRVLTDGSANLIKFVQYGTAMVMHDEFLPINVTAPGLTNQYYSGDAGIPPAQAVCDLNIKYRSVTGNTDHVLTVNSSPYAWQKVPLTGDDADWGFVLAQHDTVQNAYHTFFTEPLDIKEAFICSNYNNLGILNGGHFKVGFTMIDWGNTQP